MSVGILLITHSGIAKAFLEVAENTFGKPPLAIGQLDVDSTPDPDKLVKQASKLVAKLDTGTGVLVLTDMFGSTPSNIAQGLQRRKLHVKVVTGLNLPMLFRILNYPHLPLMPLAEKAMSGAIAGIFEPHVTPLPSSSPPAAYCPLPSSRSPSNAVEYLHYD